MATLAFVLAAFLDPVQAGIVLAVALVHRGPQPVIVAGVVAGVVSETVMALAADGYTWGELIAPRVVSSLMQAAVLCWIVRFVRTRRAVARVAPTGARRASADAAASFGSLGAGGPLLPISRPAPWQMRAYVRRQMGRLRVR